VTDGKAELFDRATKQSEDVSLDDVVAQVQSRALAGL
jgi:hypothetical protein